MDRPEARTKPAILAWLIAQLSVSLGLHPSDIDIHEPVASYGLASVEALVLLGDLEGWLGITLPQTLIWDYPTLDGLAGYLAGEAAAGTEATDGERLPVSS